ncbi:WbuC family cupin fold metalloprotein [uncultured Bacteroides sp.]|uniref:WbuC family cupin fold metalloprotein n=1 Tax=uncultured Bacteroides sp. TaxID=162156 RepID=UPI0025D9931C|nr:WbuC family cupin fold metalloprotein [uncultured Bacteroides sp.]
MIIDEQLLDQVSGQAKESERLRMNFNLHEALDAKAQRLLNALEVGTVLPVHRHRHTAETYILLRGHINVMFYNDSGEEVERYDLHPGNGMYGVHIPKGQWHTLDVMESSVIFEVKDGPYIPLGKEDILEGCH